MSFDEKSVINPEGRKDAEDLTLSPEEVMLPEEIEAKGEAAEAARENETPEELEKRRKAAIKELNDQGANVEIIELSDNEKEALLRETISQRDALRNQLRDVFHGSAERKGLKAMGQFLKVVFSAKGRSFLAKGLDPKYKETLEDEEELISVIGDDNEKGIFQKYKEKCLAARELGKQLNIKVEEEVIFK